MRELVKKALGVNLTVMRIFGYYAPTKFKNIYKIYTWVVYLCFTTSVTALATANLMLQESPTVAEISDNAFVIFEVATLIFKMFPFVWHSDEIKRCIFMLEDKVFHTCTKQQEIIVDNYIKICQRNTNFYFIFCVITFANWAILPLFESERRFPIAIWLPFNALSNRNVYILMYIYIVLGIGNVAICSGGMDPLIAELAYYAATQFNVLKSNLQFLSENNTEDISEVSHNIQEEKLKSTTVYSKIKFCIHHYNSIIHFVKVYQETFSLVVFVQLWTTSVAICFSCFRLSMVQPFTVAFFSTVLFVVALLFQVYFYCYYGTTVFEESDSIRNAIYMGMWYEYDVKSKKALIMLMERSKRPVIITAGKILDVSLATFSMIIRRSYSLLAVLKNY